jgi:signal peptidase I
MSLKKIIIITIIAFVIKLWVFEPFIIPSSSMDSTLIKGDYLIVNKWENSLFGNHLNIERGDIVTFRYPLDNVDLDEKMVFAKRCVGIPDDTVLIFEGNTSSDNRLLNFDYLITDPNESINWDLLSSINIHLGGKTINNNWLLNLSAGQLNYLKELDTDIELTKHLEDIHTANLSVFPSDTLLKWNRDHFGPIYIPKAGYEIELKLNNINIYKKIIETYESHSLSIVDSTFTIDGIVCKHYTFEQNYYFMLGDNRHHSQDSRHWGFVPENHLLANCSIVLFNIDKFSTERLLKRIQ